MKEFNSRHPANWIFVLESIINQFLDNPLLLSLIIIVGTFILEDAASLIVAGLIGSGKVDFSLGFTALFLGIFIGDFGLYFLGYAIKKGFFKSKKLSVIEKVVTSRFVFLVRFIPGLRFATYTSAGFVSFPLISFFVMNLVSCLVWVYFILITSSNIFQYLWEKLGIVTIVIYLILILFVIFYEKIKSRLRAQNIP